MRTVNAGILCSICFTLSWLVQPCQAQPAIEAGELEDQVLILETISNVTDDNGTVLYRSYRGDVLSYDRKEKNRYHTTDPVGWIPADEVIDLDNALSILASRSRRRRNDPDILADRALVQMAQGEYEEAEKTADQILDRQPNQLKMLVTRGLLYIETQQFKEALSDLQRAYDLDSKNVQTILLMIRCYENDNEYENVLKLLKDVPLDVENDADLLIDRSYAQWMVGENAEAIKSADRAIELGTKRHTPWYHRGNAYMSLREFETAIASYDEAIDRDPDALICYYFRADCYSELGQLDKAIADYTVVIEGNAEDFDALKARGRLYRSQANYPKAFEDFDYIVENAEADSMIALALFLRGLVNEDLGENEQALNDLDRSIELDQSTSGPLRERARMNYGKKGAKAAETDLLKAVEVDPNDSLSWRFLADLYRLERVPQDALECYTKVVEIDPSDSVAWNNRGLIQETLGRRDLAINDYEQAATLRPGDPTYHTNAALMHRANGDYEKADQHLLSAIEKYRSQDQTRLAELHYERGEVFRYATKFDQAFEQYEKAIELHPNHANAYNSRGICYENQGKFDKALESYNRAIELNPESPIIMTNRGDTYRKTGQNEAAFEDYSKAISMNDQLALPYNQRGLLYNNVGDYQAAISDFQEALKRDPNYGSAQGNLADALRFANQFEEAVNAYSRALISAPLSLGLLYGRAECYRQLGRQAEAEAGYQTVLSQDKSHDLSWVGLGEIYVQAGQFERAEKQFTKAIEITPDYEHALYRRGFCYGIMRKDRECIADFDKVLELSPKHVNARLFRANSYRDVGEFDNALSDYKRTLDVDPNYEYVFLGRGRCYEIMEQYGNAVIDYGRAIEIDENMTSAWNDRARILAGVTAPGVHDPEAAVKDARQACKLSENSNVNYLETLAMALAATDEFDEAVKTQQQAIELAESQGGFSKEFLQSAQDRLKQLENEEPIVIASTTKDSKSNKPTKTSNTRSGGGLSGGAGKLLGKPSDEKPSPKQGKKRQPPASDIPAPPSI